MATNPRPPRTRVCVFYTGGTVAMVPSDPADPGSPLAPGSKARIVELLQRLIPDELGIHFEVDCPLAGGPVDSADIGVDHWIEIGHALRDAYDDFDGFVIVHGTDTMAYTASALSFMFENLGKPVVLTGAQLPLSHPRTDARMNLVNSIFVAGYKATGLPRLCEVALCFGESLLRGCRARKDTTSGFNGFESPNFPPLGRLGHHISIDRRRLRPPPAAMRKFRVNDRLERDVVVLDVFPGITPALLRQAIAPESEIPRVVIMRTYGAGNMQSERSQPELVAVIREATQNGKTIISVSQCRRGMVEQGLYEASSHLADAGVISGADMTPEAALAKALVIGGSTSGPGFAQQVLLDLVGEQSVNHYVIGLAPVESADASVHRVQGLMPGAVAAEDLFDVALVVSGIESASGRRTRVRVFANSPAVDSDTPESDDDFVCAADVGGADGRMNARIKRRFQRFYRAGSVLDLALVSADGAALTARDVQLSVIERTVSL